MKNKMEYKINLDQLKTLISIKGEEKRVGRFLPSFISLTLIFPIYFSPIYPIVPPNLPTFELLVQVDSVKLLRYF